MKRLRVLLALLGALLVVPVPVSAATPAFVVANGVTQPVHADMVRESVWVDTGLDLDADGVGDRVAADIIRPATPQRVPVIMDASPYYSTVGRGNEGERKTYDAAGLPVKFPLFYDNYFVPRGYAVVLVDFAGSSRSRGCVDVGGRAEIASGAAVIDWLNGRRKGYASVTGSRAVVATWSTGAVGMIGKSWDGTIAQGVAATGINGLKTIVPIAAISSWYDYFRSDGVSFRSWSTPTALASGFQNANAQARCGAVRQQMTDGAPSNGDMTPMWEQRDFARKASSVRASVFAIHGQADLNVKTRQYGQWWEALPASVPRKLWFSQTAHVDPFDFRRAEWVNTLHRWFDRWLYGIQNGIENEPQASVERQPDVWASYASWPPAGTGMQKFYPTLDGLSVTPGSGTESFVDSGRGGPSWVTNAAGRTLFSTGVLGTDLRIAGTSSLTVSVSSSTPTAHLTAYLVDYGQATVRSGEGVENLTTESCWGENRPGDDACYLDTKTTTRSVDAQIIARGWADLANHSSLSQPQPIVPGTPYSMTFRLSTTDHIVPAGHRLALIIGGTDSSMTATPAQLPQLTVHLAGTSVQIPLLGATPDASSAPVTASRVAAGVTSTLR